MQFFNCIEGVDACSVLFVIEPSSCAAGYSFCFSSLGFSSLCKAFSPLGDSYISSGSPLLFSYYAACWPRGFFSSKLFWDRLRRFPSLAFSFDAEDYMFACIGSLFSSSWFGSFISSTGFGFVASTWKHSPNMGRRVIMPIKGTFGLSWASSSSSHSFAEAYDS